MSYVVCLSFLRLILLLFRLRLCFLGWNNSLLSWDYKFVDNNSDCGSHSNAGSNFNKMFLNRYPTVETWHIVS